MLCCFGGVCVPYTAVIPLLLVAFKWIATKLAQAGLLPKVIQDALQIKIAPNANTTTTNGSCCSKTIAASSHPSSSSSAAAEAVVVKELTSEEEFEQLLNDDHHDNNKAQKVVCKFTASWCQPCHKVQPLYEQLSAQYSTQAAAFWTIDVDEFDSIATKYKIAMMPTFLVLQGDQVLGTYRGSNEHELCTFFKEYLS